MSKFDPPPMTDPDHDLEHQNYQIPQEEHKYHHGDQQQQHPAPMPYAIHNPRPPMDMLKIVNLGLRIAGLIFSFLAFIIIVTTKGFDDFDAYNYLMATALIALVYGIFQTVKAVFVIATGKELMSDQISAPLDFIIDQVLAYLLMSASSGAFIATKFIKEIIAAYTTEKSSFVDKTVAASSMLFFAFITYMLSCLVSIHKLFLLKAAKSAAAPATASQ